MVDDSPFYLAQLFFEVEEQDHSGHSSLIFQENIQTEQEIEEEKAKSISHHSDEIYPFRPINILFHDSFFAGQPNQALNSSSIDDSELDAIKTEKNLEHTIYRSFMLLQGFVSV